MLVAFLSWNFKGLPNSIRFNIMIKKNEFLS
jgi:hypothetical protein